MMATYGFRATMKARPGKGNESVDPLLTATDGSGPAMKESGVLNLVGRFADDHDVVHAGATR